MRFQFYLLWDFPNRSASIAMKHFIHANIKMKRSNVAIISNLFIASMAYVFRSTLATLIPSMLSTTGQLYSIVRSNSFPNCSNVLSEMSTRSSTNSLTPTRNWHCIFYQSVASRFLFIHIARISVGICARVWFGRQVFNGFMQHAADWNFISNAVCLFTDFSADLLITMKQIYTTEDTKQLSIGQRKCIFSDEFKLDYYEGEYTFSSCMYGQLNLSLESELFSHWIVVYLFMFSYLFICAKEGMPY